MNVEYEDLFIQNFLNYGSEYIWSILRSKARMSPDKSYTRPNLSGWCEQIYKSFPKDKKIYQKRSPSTPYSCQSAEKKGCLYATKICSLKSWLEENEEEVLKKMKEDNPGWE